MMSAAPSAFSLEAHLWAYLSVGPMCQPFFTSVFEIQPSFTTVLLVP